MIDFIAFWSNPKVRRVDRVAGAVRSLTLFLQWCARHRPDGLLSAGDNIELIADWDYEHGAFINLLEAAELIKREAAGFRVVDWLGFDLEFIRKASRSDKARFSRMAKTHPEIYADLCRQGYREISRGDYDALTNVNEGLTIVQRSLEPLINEAFEVLEEKSGAGEKVFLQHSPKALRGNDCSDKGVLKEKTLSSEYNINNKYIYNNMPGDFVQLLPEDDILAKVLIAKLTAFNPDFIAKNKVKPFTKGFAQARVAGLPMHRVNDILDEVFKKDSALKLGKDWRGYLRSPSDLIRWWDNITGCIAKASSGNSLHGSELRPLTEQEIQVENDKLFAK